MSRKIIKLPGARLTPDVLLAQVVERATSGEVSAVAVVTQSADGVVTFGWSNMPHSQLAGLASFLMYEAMKDPDLEEDDGSAAS